MTAQPAPNKKAKQKEKKPLGQEILSLAGTLLCAVALIAVFQAYVVQFVNVNGTSMTNTLQNGEIMLVSKLDRNYQRGDIVVCHYPGRVDASFNLNASLSIRKNTIFVKRLVALPGDTLFIRGGVLYVNGEAVENPEYMGSTPRDFAEITLGDDAYFVIGDNRLTSHDSRADDVGPISRDMIRGKVKCVIWPLNAIRSVK